MTQRIKLFCKSCKSDFGEYGLHGFNPEDQTGELLYNCKKCKTILVIEISKGKTMSKCPNCNSDLLPLHTCPKCSSSELYYTDLNFPIPNETKFNGISK